MAKAKNLTDLYTSQAVFSPAETAAGTLTFEKLETGLSVYDKIGWVISRVEATLTSNMQSYFNTNGDLGVIALTQTNNLSALAVNDPAVIWQRWFQRADYGTPATGGIHNLTHVDDFSTLPGGGLLVLPNPLYGAAFSSGLAGPFSVYIRIFFQSIELEEKDYFNLVQARQLLISS